MNMSLRFSDINSKIELNDCALVFYKLSQKGSFMKQTYNNLIVSKGGVFETLHFEQDIRQNKTVH